MKILAHRGWWKEDAEKNSETAFRRAFEAGFGIETDVRDQNGVLRIAHDIPVGDGLMSFDAFLAIHKSYPQAGTIALNIKADGLQSYVRQALDEAGVQDLFCFDMAVPDALGYFRDGFVTFTRHSEIEPVPPFYDKAHGVWIDCFYSDWIQPDDIHRHLEAGKKVALVSPELHRRDHKAAWQAWADIRNDNVFLCTDLPDQAAEFWA